MLEKLEVYYLDDYIIQTYNKVKLSFAPVSYSDIPPRFGDDHLRAQLVELVPQRLCLQRSVHTGQFVVKRFISLLILVVGGRGGPFGRGQIRILLFFG